MMSIINQQLGLMQQNQDPAYQMGLEEQRLKLDAMKNPRPKLPDPMSEADAARIALDRERFAAEQKKPMVVGGDSRLVQDGRVVVDAMPPKQAAAPAEIQEYEYAKAQGFKGTLQDWKASQKGGMSLQVDPASGQVSFQQGGVNMKPLTESQSKDTVFSTRAKGALKVLDPVATKLNSYTDSAAGKVPFFGNGWKSTEYQGAEQAGNEFLQAILRKDTGAAITPEEQTLYGATYLPQPGDSKKVMEQKQASRTRAILAIEAGMSPAAIIQQELALQKDAAPVDQAQKPIDQMTDEELEAIVNGQ
jgi:hypothetical protein